MAGNSALATPAASATASAPPTRIVLRVALDGKPSFSAALVVLRLHSQLGRAAVVVAERAATEQARKSSAMARRRMAAQISRD